MRLTTIPPSTPGISNPAALRLARAYGPALAPPSAPPARIERVQDAIDLTPAARAVETAPIARLAPARPTPSEAVQDNAGLQKLVAATVPGSIDFRGETPEPGPARREALPLYRHPADRNEAATGINAGRVVDTEA